MSRDYREKEVEGVIGDIRAMLAPKRQERKESFITGLQHTDRDTT